MEVSRIRALRGPNLWSRHTAIEAIVSCTPAECNIDAVPGYEARLRNLFPEMGFLEAESHLGAISVAHALEMAALGLQASAGCPVTFSRTAKTLEEGVFQVVVEYTEEKVGRLAFDLAIELCRAAESDGAFDLASAWRACRSWTRTCASGPPPAPSCRPQWPGAFPIGASPKAAWCSLAGAASSAASRPPRPT